MATEQLTETSRHFLAQVEPHPLRKLTGFGPQPVHGEPGSFEPYEFRADIVPVELAGMPDDCYEYYYTPSSFTARERGYEPLLAIGWRLTAKGRELTEAVKAQAAS